MRARPGKETRKGESGECRPKAGIARISNEEGSIKQDGKRKDEEGMEVPVTGGHDRRMEPADIYQCAGGRQGSEGQPDFSRTCEDLHGR